MKRTPLFAIAIILLIGAIANPSVSAQAANFGWYAGAGFGSSDDDVLDETGDALKLFAGYRFHPNLAVEAAFVDLGEFDVLIFPDALEQDGLAIELVGVLPIGDKGAFFGKAGFFNWEVGAFGVTDDGTDETFGIGGEYRFGNNWAVRAEWERFNDVSGGDIDLISASVLYSFRKPVSRQRKRAAPPPEREPAKTEIPAPTGAAASAPSIPEKKPVLPELTAAERGDANAQFKLGYMYGTGQGAPKNNAEAVKWYRRAAAQGHARAQYNLGAAYANGTGLKADSETAVKWLSKAGASFIREGKRDLALRVVDTIERVIPGHALARELLAAIRAKFGQ